MNPFGPAGAEREDTIRRLAAGALFMRSFWRGAWKFTDFSCNDLTSARGLNLLKSSKKAGFGVKKLAVEERL